MNFKKFLLTFFIGFLLCFITGKAWAVNIVDNIRTGKQTDGIRLVLDGTEKFVYDAFLWDNPNRLVIDLKNVVFKAVPKVVSNELISRFRIGELSGIKGKRLVFELKGNANIKRKFALEPSGAQSKWRLVIDLTKQGTYSSPAVLHKSSHFL